MSEKVRIELTGDEALVLFDLLSRYSDSEAPEPVNKNETVGS